MVDLLNNPDQLVLIGGILAIADPILIMLFPKPIFKSTLFGIDIRWFGALAGVGLAAYGLSQGGQIPGIGGMPGMPPAEASYTNNIRRLAYYAAARRQF